MSLRIGSLFTGTGALDLAVMDVFDAEVVWHSQYEPPDKNGKEDVHQFAARILARHWPTTPNLGDITQVCWLCVLEEHGEVDILTGGFPCTDVSSAGKRAGLTPDTRSGLWAHMARAIAVLRPRMVIIENVEGLLSAQADRGLEPGAEALDEDAGTGRVLRALGAVLGDLATLGFHAEWARVAASEVGAPHPRKRVFIYAWPAAADAPDLGHERAGTARRRGTGPAHSHLAAAHTCGKGLEVRRVEPAGDERPAVERGRGEQAAPHADGGGPAGHGKFPAGRDALRRRVRVRDDAHRRGPAPADADSLRWRAEVLELRPGQPDLDWGVYEPAIRRWEAALGRPAPWPTDLRGRLTPVFSEWMMGLPDGWVTCTPGPESMSAAALRNAMLRALGNGVVRLQGSTGIRYLHQRAATDTAQAA
jgi:DNA (cytosine-5)-methyltransferase 1